MAMQNGQSPATTPMCNWQRSRKRYIDWWNRKGLVIASWKNPYAVSRRMYAEQCEPNVSCEAMWLNPDFVVRFNEYRLRTERFYFDTLPIANADVGPGSLCLMLGCQVRQMTPGTVWYESPADITVLRRLHFDEGNRWWKTHAEILKALVVAAQDRYFVGCPDLIENLDILASLNGTQELLYRLVEEPDGILAEVDQVNEVFFDVYEHIYRIIACKDGSCAFGAFQLWAPGKVAKVQCDLSAMLSTEMFNRLVVPALSEQCRWLDYSMYHLDGTQALIHLDSLLTIPDLDAIEWTPQAGLPQGGSAKWYTIYKKILDGGKSVQAIHVKPQEVLPLLEACGSDGFYLAVDIEDEKQVDELAAVLYDKYGYETDIDA